MLCSSFSYYIIFPYPNMHFIKAPFLYLNQLRKKRGPQFWGIYSKYLIILALLFSFCSCISSLENPVWLTTLIRSG